MSEQGLTEQFSELVDRCASTEEGQQALAMFDHVVQFTPLDGEPFYLEVREGEGAVAEGVMPEGPITDVHEIKANTDDFEAWFSGRERLSDLIEHGRMFPVASHTTKRHIDHWLAEIVRHGNALKAPKEVY